MNPNTRSSMRRVVVTGMGVVSALGNDVDSFWHGLMHANSGIAETKRTGADWAASEESPERFLAAEVALAAQAGLNDLVSAQYLDRFALFAVHAAGQALAQAGIAGHSQPAGRMGVIVGTAMGGDEAHNYASYRTYVKRRQPAPQTILRAMYNSAAAGVSMAFGLKGPGMAIASACASGAHAIGQAYGMVRSGLADSMLAGGSEQLPSYVQYRAWQQLRVLSNDGCRPFCASRNGMVLGEGAGVVVLESLASAQERGAAILGEVVGCGMNSAASDWLQPDVDSMVDCIAQALRQADTHPEQVGFINAHGTGTLLNDSAEAQAILRVFGRRGGRLPVSSTKGMHGHTLGASGAMECVAALLSLAKGLVPPNGASHQTASDCELDIVHGESRLHESSFALSHSFAFGGMHAVLALRRHVD